MLVQRWAIGASLYSALLAPSREMTRSSAAGGGTLRRLLEAVPVLSFFSLFIFTPLIYSHSHSLTLTRQVGNSYSYYSRRLAFW